MAVVQFGVKIGCSSLNSSADRWGPELLSTGAVPSPALPGPILPCKIISSFAHTLHEHSEGQCAVTKQQKS